MIVVVGSLPLEEPDDDEDDRDEHDEGDHQADAEGQVGRCLGRCGWDGRWGGRGFSTVKDDRIEAGCKLRMNYDIANAF